MLNLDPGIKRKAAVLKELPPIPVTGWKAPTEFPDLRDAKLLSFDTETKDPHLLDHGPGWGRKQGHIIGLSVAATDRTGNEWCGYFPIRHEVNPHENCNAANVLAWARDMLQTPMPKTGANLMYDVGWLAEDGINVQGPLYDVQYAEALLDENGKTALDYIARKYLNDGKSSAGMYEWLARAYGGNASPVQRANMYRCPPALAGFYGEGDARLPLRILPLQWAKLASEELLELYVMECKLTRLLIKMRQTGVRVDLDYAEQLYAELGGDIVTLQEKFARDYNSRANHNSSQQLGPLFEAQGIKVPRTEAGQYSIQKVWLEGIRDEAPIANDVLSLRELDKLRSTFVRSYILEGNVNGRLHCSFNPLKVSKGDSADTKGAKTGRLSSSDPNLQNIPSRSKVGKKIRRAFIPDIGHENWRKYDYSQIEYRMLAHFACDNGDGSADKLRQSYINDPLVDYHDYVYYAACPYMGWDASDNELKVFKRRGIKNTNFGLLYGQGQGKLARTMNLTPQQARDFFVAYHEAAPYVKPTMQMCADEVHKHGFVRTILGRRTRFDLWQPYTDRYSNEELPDPIPYDLAIIKWGSNIKRAYEYRAVNYKFQGSAADMMKRAMVLMDESGVFDAIGVPKLTVHDELDFSAEPAGHNALEAWRYMQHIMETAIPLSVPVRADPDIGPNWGACG